MTAFCQASPFDIGDRCVQAVYAAIVPAVLVSSALILSLPNPLSKLATNPFARFMTVTEAESIIHSEKSELPQERAKPPRWKTFIFASLALLETVIWSTLAIRNLVHGRKAVWEIWTTFVVAATWFYAFARPLVHPKTTPHYDLFMLYIIHFVNECLSNGRILYEKYIFGAPLPPAIFLVASVSSLATPLILVLVTLTVPVGIPSAHVAKNEIGTLISPEDYTSLWGWLSFSWVKPLIARGASKYLEQEDVWALSPSFQAKPLFAKFNRQKSKTLFRKLAVTNSLDLILDASLSTLSILFNYAGPYLLRRILDAAANPTREALAKAYIFAVLAFCASMAKAQADLGHLWIGRRAGTRIRSELITAIYDKALRRRDLSGNTAKDEAQEDDEAKKSKDKKEEDKAGADVGKIVQLMSGDVNRISGTAMSIFMLYSAPLEIAIACTLLYQMLGFSAFVGFSFLIIILPFNRWVSKKTVEVSEDLSAARDKRMSVLTELLGGVTVLIYRLAVKFIKFFAWELQWIKRATDAREAELKLLVKERIYSSLFELVWTLSPVIVSLISILTFILTGHELTVSIAFTSLALFKMLELPLSIAPMFLVQALQTRVSINRIGDFLDEEEVPDDVSSLKRVSPNRPYNDDDAKLGIVNASLRWNQPAKAKTEDADAKGKAKATGHTQEITVVPDVTHPEAQHVAMVSETTAVGDTDVALLTEDQEENVFELRDINVIFPTGELSILTGPTASGKSALLMAILGEMTKVSAEGTLHLPKNPTQVDQYGLSNAISYCAQTPWLEGMTIKNNILFGSSLDEERYHEVLEACALLPDLAVLEDGDQTEIGAKGVSLSGGQKARVALARAVYARNKHVLLDDPLAAVDSHTARLLVERLLQGPLLANRTVILVTHHIELVLPVAYYIIRMLDGRIDTQGIVKDLRNRGELDFIAHDSVHESEGSTANKPTSAEDAAAAVLSSMEDKTLGAETGEVKKPRKLVEDEARATGKVKWGIYKTYLEACSLWIWVYIAVFVIAYQCLGLVEKLWLEIWGNAYDDKVPQFSMSALSGYGAASGQNHIAQTRIQLAPSNVTVSTLPRANEHPLFYMGILAAISITAVLLQVINVVAQFVGAFWGSRALFARLLDRVVYGTMRWFDVTPTGRILNRFGRDMETIDGQLGSSIHNTFFCISNFAAAIIAVSIVLPPFLVPAALIGYLYYRLSTGYLKASRELQRLESNTRSPIYSSFEELLNGIITVRAFGAERRFFDNVADKVDLTTKFFYSVWMLNRYLLVRFDLLGATSVFLTTVFVLSGLNLAAWAGLTITSAMSFTMSVYWTCRFVTQLEMDLNSVERVVEYLDLPQEPAAIVESNRPPAYWPSSTGSENLVHVENLVVRYAPDLPPVLHGVSFALKPKERIGLLGRTGSGKSTLAMALLRFVEPTEGTITIDGIDVTKIGLRDLRSKLTIIPQDAVLFSGTIRDNLDPFGDYGDAVLIATLERVHLTTSTESVRTSRASSIHTGEGSDARPGTPSSGSGTTFYGDERKNLITLESKVSPGGSNFSQGQRQLIAMARALLRQSSVIIMDEATSSIDFETDSKIQTTIREEFQNSLLITVAHRIRTVIDYDRLIILDKGEIVEFDTPLNLIEKEGGLFRDMCLKSGTFEELRGAAATKAQLLAQEEVAASES